MKRWVLILIIVLIVLLLIIFFYPKTSSYWNNNSSKECKCLGFEKKYTGLEFEYTNCYGIYYSCLCGGGFIYQEPEKC